MLAETTKWSHPLGNTVVPSPWQTTIASWKRPEFVSAEPLGLTHPAIVEAAEALCRDL